MRYVICLLILFMMLLGCANNNNQASPPSQNNHEVRVKQTIPPKQEITDDEKVSTRLEKLAMQVPDVEGARCVVMGNTAIVGIDVDSSLDRSRIGTIKYSVAEALRKDPHGAHAMVTADIDLNARLREIRQEIANGRPFSGFAEEMADIVGRMMPQLPKDVRVTPHQEDQRKEDQQKLDQSHM
ncbi:YhcN/YlaJ family sporulation lipoprotein [Marinicrinis sediminis]|uniref:YhcN/YlaJ family sporulation lipoprotein n=1 Tax=Marinicrinis sediminis TaxID=1652465 RepID=A0ABW5RD67_9BACL